ncbi:MAG: VOC family protein [Mariniblastus sp.]
MNLNQITVPSVDLDASIKFYQALGLKLIVDSAPRYARLECPDGEATFSIHRVDALPSGNGTCVYFETAKLDEEVERLVTAGIEFDLMPVDQTWLWREARLKDPDGNAVILFYAGENRKNPPWRI